MTRFPITHSPITRLSLFICLSLVVFSACDANNASQEEVIDGDPCLYSDSIAATATCLTAVQEPEYYVEQALLYFDTLDLRAPEENIPNYHEQVARWEWPPWLLLTGFGAEDMINASLALRRLDPSTVPQRDCRFFPVQPFARCYVTFEYEKGACPIYEEFTFNDQGEMTFIEAWSLESGEIYADPDALWGERNDFPRLSSRIPGLGTKTGNIPYHDETLTMQAELLADSEVLDYLERITNWRRYWAEELGQADRDFFAQGCGW